MLDLKAQITGRIAWLKGTDDEGVTRYAPAGKLTILSFAKTVLGDIDAHVETIMGDGVCQFPWEPWSVFGTLNLAEQHLARLGQTVPVLPNKTASS
jgi:hypothetical protein